MVPDRQKVRTDGRTDGMDGRTDDAKTISLRLRRGIIRRACTLSYYVSDRGSYMSAHVLLNLINELGKRDKMRGLPSILSLGNPRILSLFCNEFNKFNNTRARMLDSIYHMTLR